jgi:2-dehydro-3-deoxyphosphogluconate aldolase/(4S)-4-hydroxy-2-oxoglutarate aldolase
MTATEIALAEESGATLVKLFPGNLLGPSYVTAIKELFPKLRFMPTGGTEPETGNLKAWFDSGVVAVGMGSKLISAAMLQEQDYESVAAAAARALSLISSLGKVIT